MKRTKDLSLEDLDVTTCVNLVLSKILEHKRAKDILWLQSSACRYYLGLIPSKYFRSMTQALELEDILLHKTSYQGTLPGDDVYALQRLILESVGRPKQWEITHPDGSTEVISHLSNFAKQHGLQQHGLQQVLSGLSNSHKGYKIRRV